MRQELDIKLTNDEIKTLNRKSRLKRLDPTADFRWIYLQPISGEYYHDLIIRDLPGNHFFSGKFEDVFPFLNREHKKDMLIHFCK